MSDFLEEKHFSSASDFLDYLQPREHHWLPDNEFTIPWVFRGQSRARWDLVPSALRENQFWFNNFKQSISQNVRDFLLQSNLSYAAGFDLDIKRLGELIVQIAAEWNAVDEFIELADQVGHQLPSDEGAFLGTNKKLSWEEIAGHFVANIRLEHCYNQWDPEMIKFALTQHHGIPTRLLDWTYSPFVAAFFAAEEALDNKQINDDLAVWAINYTQLDSTDIKIVSHKRAKISYLHAQSGLFIYDSMTNLEFLRSGLWRSIKDALATTKPITNAILRKITVDAKEAKTLLRLLSAEGITRAHIMPTFDNVTETLKMKREISRR